MENQKDLQTKLVPGVGRLPYPAYRGNEPYVFISYAHDDKDKVFAEIKRFNEAGFHVWYDEGISPGNEWTDEIADALERCCVFVVMITPVSAPRKNVLNEINFALDENKPFLAIHLEKTELKGGLKLRTGSTQAILKYNMTEEEYEYKYIEAFTRFGLKRDNAQSVNTPAAKAVELASAAKDESIPVKANSDSAVKSGDGVTISRLDELAKRFLGANKPVNQKETVKAGEEYFDDSPEDARKRANGDLVRIDGEYKEIGKEPSRSVELHREIYKQHPHVNSIILAHSPNLMAFVVSDQLIDSKTIPESYILLRDIQKMPYGKLYADQEEASKYFDPAHPAVMVENNCVIVTGNTLLQAFDRLEVLESTAYSLINASSLGEIDRISDEEVADLKKAFNLVD